MVVAGSLEPRAVLEGDAVPALGAMDTPELRTGGWTRLGSSAVLGDAVTEGLLGGLAESTRAAARAQGYSVGWTEGRREAARQAEEKARMLAQRHAAAEARREAEHRGAVQALGEAARQVRALADGMCAAIEEQGTALAWALTEEIVGREVAVLDGPDVVRRVLRVLPATPVGRVRLHPAVVTDPAVAELLDRGLEVVADAALGRADALVESDGSVTDLRVSEALARVREVLR